MAYLSWPNLMMVMNFALGFQLLEDNLGIERQKTMAGVSYMHTYLSELLFGMILHGFACAIFYIVTFKYDLRGFWAPSLLYVVASPLFNQFLMSKKNKTKINTLPLEFIKLGMGLLIVLSGVE